MIVRKEFYFLRHGQTEHNVKKIFTTTDENPPLTEIGIQQAEGVRKFVCNLPVKTICHSPLERAIQTMQIATEDLNAHKTVVHDLKECTGPIWLSMVKGEMTEEVNAFLAQTLSGINQALKHPGPVLIVAHGGLHWALCSLLQIEDHQWDIENCHLAHFRPDGEGWKASLIS